MIVYTAVVVCTGSGVCIEVDELGMCGCMQVVLEDVRVLSYVR